MPFGIEGNRKKRKMKEKHQNMSFIKKQLRCYPLFGNYMAVSTIGRKKAPFTA